jgi:hypothetical protein
MSKYISEYTMYCIQIPLGLIRPPHSGLSQVRHASFAGSKNILLCIGLVEALPKVLDDALSTATYCYPYLHPKSSPPKAYDISSDQLLTKTSTEANAEVDGGFCFDRCIILCSCPPRESG